MRLYTARIRGTNEVVTFNGEILVVSDPEIVRFLLETRAQNGGPRLYMEDLVFVESEWEKLHEC